MEQFSMSNVSGNIVNIHEYSNEKSQQRIQVEDQLPFFSELQMDIENETSYIAQAQKRLLCTRLTKFLHLIDYKLANLFHQMVVSTASDFLNKLKENLTGHAIELHDNDEEEHNVVDIETEMDLSSDENKPLFLIKLVLEEKDFAFCPTYEEFLTNVKEAVEKSKKAVMTFENLASDDYFETFTSPVINGKQEENEVAQGPVLTEMFQEDENLHRLLLDIEQTLQTAFVMATKQAENYRPLYTFYLENEKLNLAELVEHEEDVQFYSTMLSKFYEQHKMIEAVPKFESVGLILMDNSVLQAETLPSPLKCIEILNNRLPKLAKTKVDLLSNEANIAQSKLVSTPNSTTELVERLTFLDKIERRIEDMEAGLNVTRELYDLMDSYSVPVPPEDIAGYSALGGLLCHLQKTIKNESSERETYKTNLNTSLVKDIDKLKQEVKDLKRDVEESFLMDVNSEPRKVTDLLSSLAVRLEQITEQASQYKQYQRDFQFEVTHYEELEKVASELRLKQLLWNSFFTWNALMQEWRECDFENINPEHLRTQTTEYLKTIHQIERGLPVNSVTLSLKEKLKK
ncbi:dynein axonemal heavy chain 6-like [Tachypleus tridentatus]|uniref:dynein axonemal heavy chain 6-like n=1 Tax=Tachypleus tridentatus TaxID=6853 RepID=UPI003FD45300